MKYLNNKIFILIVLCFGLYEAEASNTLCSDIHVARVLGFKQRNGTAEFYWLSFYKGSAINSRNFCLRLGAELPQIRNQNENDFIKSFLVNETEIWTAGVHTGNNTYKWLTGNNMTYTNWLKKTDEPNGAKLGDNYVLMFGRAANSDYWGFWADANESLMLRALCVLKCG